MKTTYDFIVCKGLLIPDANDKKNILRMAELMKIGCKEKKSKGNNWKSVSTKEKHIKLMKDIGFVSYTDTWISCGHTHMALEVLGWKDVRKNSINRNKMVAYGYLKWIMRMNPDLVNLIIKFL